MGRSSLPPRVALLLLLLLLSLLLLLPASLPAPLRSPLSVGPAVSQSAFASASAWSALVDDVRSLLRVDDGEDGGRAPLFILLAWHSAASFSHADGRGGVDGADIRRPPESAWPANRAAAPAMAALERLRLRHVGRVNVSVADLLALTAVAAVRALGGPAVPLRIGRASFARRPLLPHTASRIPLGNATLPSLLSAFRAMGLGGRELVALVGAHVIGRAHRTHSGYAGRWSSARPLRFTNDYYRALVDRRWTPTPSTARFPLLQYCDRSCADDGALMRLPSDLSLLGSADTRRWVTAFARNQSAFFAAFQRAFAALLELGTEARALRPAPPIPDTSDRTHLTHTRAL